MSARTRFVQLALSKLGSTVLWNNDGPNVFDCSGLPSWSLKAVGGLDLRATHNAQRYADETPDLATAFGALPLPGDFAFYGSDAGHVIHMVIWLADGRCLSADGASSYQRDLKTAQANPSNRVRLHDSLSFRRGLLGVHRNTFVDDLDHVCR